MPAHNESDLLETSVRTVVEGLRSLRQPFELVVVENGSTDATAAIARKLAEELDAVELRTLPRADYGQALRTGLLESGGDVVATFDVDYYDLDFLALALAELDRGRDPADLVIASKRASGARDRRPRFRRLVTAGFTGMLRLGFGLRVSDTHGMKVLRRATVEPLARRCKFGADLFDTELILRAERAGLAIVELPVTIEELRPPRTSISRRVPRTLLGMLRLRVALWRERRR